MQKQSTVTVVGGGVAGLTAAVNLAQRGVSVTLVERESALGGNALTVCCKAIDGVCQFCGACLLADAIAKVKECEQVNLLYDTIVTHVERGDDGFHLGLSSHDSPVQGIHCDAVVLATGFDHVDAHTKGPYGYGILPAVTTGHEVEKRLKERGQAAYDGLNLRKVAFIQCVGSRDEHVGRGYCSQVCCRYALRLARLFKRHLPEAELAVFKMDMQINGRDFAAAWEATNKEGIRLIAGLPAVIRRSTETPGRAAMLYDDILGASFKQEDWDLIVLSVGIQPRRDAPEVSRLFGINQDRYGFFAVNGDGASTINHGVFVAGCCQGPRSIAESIAHAQQAAQACYRYLQERIS